jgi:TonB-dependent receptor
MKLNFLNCLVGYRKLLLGVLPGLLAPITVSFAQDGPMEEVVVTGYRGSLQNSTAAKRNSVGFSDEVFADDIGKMPSQNLAESLSRIPGVKINREVTGEGLQISVRGLGPSFTKVVLNGNNISIASDGPLGSGQRNREVDLGVFPAELFSSLSVSKSSNANQMEGGISGYVNLRPARAFDAPGQQIKFSGEGAYSEINSKTNPRASLSYSNTWNDTVGLFVGLATRSTKSRVDGYETIGYTDGCLLADDGAGGLQCAAGSLGRNHIDWNPTATADYVAVHGGAVGDPLDLEAITGQSAETLDSAIFPYLGRGVIVDGDRDTTTALVSFEYRPSDSLNFTIDAMNTQSSNHFNRADIMLYARRTRYNAGEAMIPENMTVDSNGVITDLTLYNSSYFTEQRDYIEDLDFYALMPSLNWQIRDGFEVDISASYTSSKFDRDNPTWLYQTPQGVTHYTQNGDVPSFDVDFDLNGTTGWQWYLNGASGFRTARAHRETDTTGLHADFGLGDDPDRSGVKFGIAFDNAERNMKAYAAPAGYGDDVYAMFPDPSQFLVPMNASDFGGTMDGNLGYRGWAQINYNAIKKASNYKDYYRNMTLSGGDEFGQTVGDIDEEYVALYAMLNTEGSLLDRTIRTNVGVRFVTTDQTMGYLDVAAGEYLKTDATYEEWLPSFSTVFDVADNVKLRASASKSMTRANPAFMFPNAAFSSVGIDSVRAGNPNLNPYFSDNIDIGGEWYFNDIGYVGFTIFNKKISGFTRSDQIDIQFNQLPNYGIDISNLDAARQAEIDACGGINSPSCTTTVTTQINVQGGTTLKGFEAVWVQPLDNWVNGLGFNASVTKINQSSDSAEAEVTGISPWTYNFTGYYENETFQARVTYFHQDESVVSGPQGYNNDPLPLRRLVSIARSQVDLAASYRLPTSTNLVLTFDAYNLTNEPVGNWFEYEGTAYDIYYPGATYTFGLRGSF